MGIRGKLTYKRTQFREIQDKLSDIMSNYKEEDKELVASLIIKSNEVERTFKSLQVKYKEQYKETQRSITL